MVNLFARLSAAFRRASTTQWVAYIIAMVAIVMLIYVIVDRLQSPRVTEQYSMQSEPIKENESKNCSESAIGVSDGDPGCSETSLEKCNKMTFDQKAVFDDNLTMFKPSNANTFTSGMKNVHFCNNKECSETRSLQDVVNEYRYYHIPYELHKVNTNHIPIASEFDVLMKNRCKINDYIKTLKERNNNLYTRLQNDEDNIMKVLRDRKTNLEKSLPSETV